MGIGVEITEIVRTEKAAITARRGADVEVELEARFDAEQTLRAVASLEELRGLTIEDLAHVLQKHVAETAGGEDFGVTIVQGSALTVKKFAAETFCT